MSKCKGKSRHSILPDETGLGFDPLHNQGNLINIGCVVGTFGRASGLQRLKNQLLYHEILLLQKFNDIMGKVIK